MCDIKLYSYDRVGLCASFYPYRASLRPISDILVKLEVDNFKKVTLEKCCFRFFSFSKKFKILFFTFLWIVMFLMFARTIHTNFPKFFRLLLCTDTLFEVLTKRVRSWTSQTGFSTVKLQRDFMCKITTGFYVQNYNEIDV